MPVGTITRGLAAPPPPVPAGGTKVRIFDDRVRGFVMEHRRSGGVTFWFRYSDERHRQRELSLGRFGDVTVDQARRRAAQLRAQVSLGGDPGRDRDRRRAIPTFAGFVADRFLPHIRSTIRSHPEYEGMCRLRLVPALGRLRLDEIDAAAVGRLRQRMINEGLSNARVNRHLAVLRRALNLGLRWRLYEGPNPAQHPGMLRERHRERYLTEAETRALMAALAADPDRTAAAAIALIALTSGRKSEIFRNRWENLDAARRQLAVPVSKSGRRRFIPLSDHALALLAGLPRVPGNPHIFPSRCCPGRPIGGARAAWGRPVRASRVR